MTETSILKDNNAPQKKNKKKVTFGTPIIISEAYYKRYHYLDGIPTYDLINIWVMSQFIKIFIIILYPRIVVPNLFLTTFNLNYDPMYNFIVYIIFMTNV